MSGWRARAADAAVAQRNQPAATRPHWGAGVSGELPLGKQPKEHVVPHGLRRMEASVDAGSSLRQEPAKVAGKGQRARRAETRLRSAAFAGDIDVIKRLLDQDLEAELIDRCDRKGWTALMYAAVSGNHGAVQQLVGRGADLGCKNDQGRTALDLAESRGHDRTVAYLKLCGAPGSPFAKLSPNEAVKPVETDDLWSAIAESAPRRLAFSPHPEVRQYEPAERNPEPVHAVPDFLAFLDKPTKI